MTAIVTNEKFSKRGRERGKDGAKGEIKSRKVRTKTSKRERKSEKEQLIRARQSKKERERARKSEKERERVRQSEKE